MTEVGDVKQSSIISRDDLLNAIRKLPPTKSLRGKSHKEMWLHWLTKYGDPAYGRVNPNRSAEYIYNAVHLPAWIIWLAAASGTSPQLLRKATGAINPTQSRQTQGAAVRRVLPWSLVAKQLAKHLRERKTIEPIPLPEPQDDLVRDLEEIQNDKRISKTTRQALINARRGQGEFRADLERRWNGLCAVTACGISAMLRASHIKPWSKSSNRDRLNPANDILVAARLMPCSIEARNRFSALVGSWRSLSPTCAVTSIAPSFANEISPPIIAAMYSLPDTDRESNQDGLFL
jgi:hypothetical protein